MRRTHEEFVNIVKNIVKEEYIVKGKYVNARTKILMLHTKCNHEYMVAPDKFINRGQRCPLCYGTQRHNYSYIKSYIEKYNYKLIDKEYVNSYTKLNLICDNGHKLQMPFKHFNSGHRCKQCDNMLKSEQKRHDYKYVKEYFKKHNCKLLEIEYIRNDVPMRYICECGNDNEAITFNSFASGHRCEICRYKKASKSLRFDYEYVKDYFKKYDCELLEDIYINQTIKMKYRCSCGNISEINFHNFKQGRRCMQCSHKSKGIKRIERLLKNNNVDYTLEYTFNDLKNSQNQSYRFDVAVFSNDAIRLIEFDGEQHFIESEFWGGKKALERTQLNDAIKNEYCKSNNINLLRIRYDEYDDIKKILKKYNFI